MTLSRRAVAVVAIALVLGAPIAACSSSGSDGAADPATAPTVPSSSGDSCTDPTGDLDLPAGVASSTPGLTGIDLVESSATVDGTQLDISLTMAGPIDAAPAATYVVAQGDPLGSFSFELRMVHGTDGWSTTLITWPDGDEARNRLPITPTVQGATITASVPLSSLPPISLAMKFGASAQVGDDIVFDDCSSLNGG